MDTKFKVFRIRFIFDLFVKKFLKMDPIRVRFSLGFSLGVGFPGEEFAPVWL
jgi:hypothetical protein